MVDYSTLKNYNIMNKQRLNYLAPEAETLVIRFEGAICGSNDTQVSGNRGGSYGYYSGLDDDE